MTKLKIEDLWMQYEDCEVLSGINFQVENGEFLSILGPSGCGKTTILRILIGLLKPTKGKILMEDRDITNLPSSQRNMGIVFQNYALFENMTVRKNVEYALRTRKENKSREARERITREATEIMKNLGILPFENMYPSNLSGGQQQRTASARTLIMKPDMILFDEPMSALDAATRLQLRQELKRIQREFGITMIYITHDQEEAFAMSDRIMVMERGRIAQIDTPENILQHPADAYVEDFVLNNLRMKMNSIRKYVDM